MSIRRFLWLPLLPVALMSCGSGDEGTGSPSPSPTGTPVPATFSQVRDTILVPSCGQFSPCHLHDAGGLTLTADEAYGELVDVASIQIPSMKRVVPGDPDNSYLIWKLTNMDGIVGDEMPPGALISDEKLQMVESWIRSGAPNN